MKLKHINTNTFAAVRLVDIQINSLDILTNNWLTNGEETAHTNVYL